MSFKLYLENVVSEKNSGRVTEILKQRIERKLNTTLYVTRVMDVLVDSEGKSYSVFMMFADGHHALRLNWKTADTSSSIERIDFWIHVSKNPQFSASTKDMNIVQLVNLIDDVISGAKTDSADDSEVLESYIAEASGFSMKDVKQLFEKAGYSLSNDPAFTVRRYLVTNRKTKEVIPIRYNPTVGQMYDDIKSMGIEAFIETNYAGGGKKASSSGSGMVKAARPDAVQPVKASPFDSLFEDPLSEKELFALLDKGIADIRSGKSKVLLVCGDPGIGKTFTITKQLAGNDTKEMTGSITSAATLYKMLYMYNKAGRIIIFDDLDKLFDDREMINILKGALDSKSPATVDYISANTRHPEYFNLLMMKNPDTGAPFTHEEILMTRDKEIQRILRDLQSDKIDFENISEKNFEADRLRMQNPQSQGALLPSKFEYVSKTIFISNMYLDEIPTSILSRGGTKIEVNLTLEEIVKRIENLLPKIEVPVEPGTPPITMAEKKAAIDYCNKVLIPYGKIRKIDFRSFFDICRLASGNAPKELWWKWASRNLMEAYGDKDTSTKRKKR